MLIQIRFDQFCYYVISKIIKSTKPSNPKSLLARTTGKHRKAQESEIKKTHGRTPLNLHTRYQARWNRRKGSFALRLLFGL